MLSIGSILEYTESLDILSRLLGDLTTGLSAFSLLVLLIFVSWALSNGINNAAAAVFMAPLAVSFAEKGSIEIGAALMAVAAGGNMTLLLPTHQGPPLVEGLPAPAPAPDVRHLYRDWDRDRPTFVLCNTSNRSMTAGSLLKQRGFQRVINVLGGTTAWAAAGYPMETGGDGV